MKTVPRSTELQSLVLKVRSHSSVTLGIVTDTGLGLPRPTESESEFYRMSL